MDKFSQYHPNRNLTKSDLDETTKGPIQEDSCGPFYNIQTKTGLAKSVRVITADKPLETVRETKFFEKYQNWTTLNCDAIYKDILEIPGEPNQGATFYICEPVTENLATWFRRGPHPESAILNLAHQIFNGIYSLQKTNLAHLNLRLENLYWVNRPEFQGSQLITSKFGSAMELTNNCILVKDLGYARGGHQDRAPELIKGLEQEKIQLDKADIYTAGKILQKITGNNPGKLTKLISRALAENPADRLSAKTAFIISGIYLFFPEQKLDNILACESALGNNIEEIKTIQEILKLNFQLEISPVELLEAYKLA